MKKIIETYWNEEERAPHFILEDGTEWKPIHPNMANYGFPLNWEKVESHNSEED